MQIRAVIDSLAQAVEALAAGCARLDPDEVPAEQVMDLHSTLTRAERLATGARVRLARRLVDAAAVADVRPDVWMAARTGTTLADARRQLRVSADLALHPHLDAALEAGAVSARQVDAIAGAVAANPAAEAELVGRAASGRSDLADLRQRARRAVAQVDADPDATRARHHRRRAFRTWTEDDGEWHAHLNAPADAGAAIMAAIKDAADVAFRAAHAQGRREPSEAYAFDGLLHTVTEAAAPTESAEADGGDGAAWVGGVEGTGGGRTAGGSRGRERKVIGIVDVAALRRGHLEPDDRCEISGVGPVSLSAIRDLLGEATLAILFRRGTVDLAVAHLGRQPTAFQRTAVEARGYVCAVDGCGVRTHLEIDHTRSWATTRRTETANLDWLCRRHHDAKTRGQLQLVGPPGGRTAVPAPRARPP